MKLDAETLVLAKAITGGGGGGGGSSTVTLISDVPTFTSTMTYDGTEQTASFNNYDSDKMTVSGNTATNAGTYTAKFKPKKGYYWDNGDGTGSNEEKSVVWSIGKATASITLSESAITLDAETLYTDVSITAKVGTGALSVASSDTTVATVGDIENDTFRITANNDEKSGNATVTVSMAESDNYMSASATVSVNVYYVNVYGAEWAGGSDPTWTRTDKATSFANPNPYYSGMSGTPSSPFDNFMPWSGMTIVEDANVGTLVRIPKFWYKWTRDGDKMKLQIADGEASGFKCSPAHMNRGDGQGERDFVYVGRYSSATSTYKSTSGVSAQGSKTRSAFRSSISSLGSEIWQWDFAVYETIMMLFLVEFAHWNVEGVIGKLSSTNTNGVTDNMPYHTGTSANDRTTGGTTQYRYIESISPSCLIDGIYGDAGSPNEVKIITNPNDFSDSQGGYSVYSRTEPVVYGCCKKIARMVNANYDWVLIPEEGVTDSTYSSYTCMYFYIGKTGVVFSSNATRYAFSLANGSTSTSAGTFSRLMKLPNAS